MFEHAHKGINQHLEKKGGKVKSEHAHKRHQHLKKRGKVMSEHAHKGTSIWKEKRERGNSCLGMLIKAPETGK